MIEIDARHERIALPLAAALRGVESIFESQIDTYMSPGPVRDLAIATCDSETHLFSQSQI